MNYQDSSWPAIIEKAWAKVQGCYENTKGGYSTQALGILTGVPVFNELTSGQGGAEAALFTTI